MEVQAASLLRRISISVHRENARAVLRRLPGAGAPTLGTAPEAWSERAEHAWQ